MRIAQIAPLVESVPPAKYGGTERIVHILTEELVKRGHDVTLFASGDSQTAAKLVSGYPQNLRHAGIEDRLHRNSLTLAHATLAYEHASEFDVIHDHVGVLSLPLAHTSLTPVIATLHGAFFDHNIDIFKKLNKPYYVTISNDQAAPVPDLHAIKNIYHGLPLEDYPFSEGNDGYLLYVGRITPQKGTHYAVQIAQSLNMPLIIAAKLEKEQQDYFDYEVKPYLSDTIRWIGEVDETERNQLMSRAVAFLHPAPWREPFGLTLIEAMATGCPVMALRRGSVPEIVQHKKTGIVTNDVVGLVKNFSKIYTIDRHYVRNYARGKFSFGRMVDQYEDIYNLVAQATPATFYRQTNTLRFDTLWPSLRPQRATTFSY